MVDVRCGPAPPPGPAPAAPDLPPPPPSQPDNHLNQQVVSGDIVGHPIPSPASVRASTPANQTTITTYSGGMGGYSACPVPPYAMCGGMGPGMKSGLVWCAPPPTVNPHVHKSVQPNGSDLPMNDIATLRYFFNLGVECMWSACAPPLPPPAHYSPINDLAQDMQQNLSLQDRSGLGNNHSGHNDQNKGNQNKGMNQQGNMGNNTHNNQPKGNGQRTPLGPRFKRGGNGDGNQGSHQNKGYNNNSGPKGPNNRRNSHTDNRLPNHMNSYGPPVPPVGDNECPVMERPMLTMPYMPYPPPLYPMPYYPIETDPGMMGMMGSGVGYVNYMGEELPDPYPPPLLPPAYYPPYPPPPQPPLHHHEQHK